jgi:hypothetical protein
MWQVATAFPLRAVEAALAIDWLAEIVSALI